METTSLNHCFGCGKDNPIGLHLKNTYISEKSHIEFKVNPEYCGHPGLLHGGVTCILFDEVMFYAVARLGIETVTLTITIDYKSPALEGHHLICEAWIKKHDGRKIDVVAIINDSETGRVIAEGKGKYLEVDLQKVLAAVNMADG
jgi:uncharacterized protein (TIGR00369 family)